MAALDDALGVGEGCARAVPGVAQQINANKSTHGEGTLYLHVLVRLLRLSCLGRY